MSIIPGAHACPPSLLADISSSSPMRARGVYVLTERQVPTRTIYARIEFPESISQITRCTIASPAACPGLFSPIWTGADSRVRFHDGALSSLIGGPDSTRPCARSLRRNAAQGTCKVFVMSSNLGYADSYFVRSFFISMLYSDAEVLARQGLGHRQ
ncbi:hypothetical protein HYPSUDRAFT_441033 [Hypholoma sublateritium FD-334 SS-4]|uniref:Uncharacterized protein n=1 Tax=Hypholoma sublateritium (strain FD-334 SS-4) TaxID=945553 RepID=A0A0D2MML7_HYPSF|nr:hypothetical protein HYPSUDRAFT_441033 [Hypholoma sublateritium FD-334 SS-4]